MSEIASSERASAEPEKPAVTTEDEVQLPPFPDPTDLDFDDITEEEQNHYKNKYPDLSIITSMRLHCTACDRHLGCSPLNESRMRTHPMLRTLICQTCHSFYNSGEFDRGEDGSELYCRWCGQGGQVYCCSDCIHVFCAKCIKRNLGLPKIKEIENTDDWKCFKCNPNCLWDLRALCWALLRYCDLRNKFVDQTEDTNLKEKYSKVLAIDKSECCKNKARRSQKFDAAKKKEKDAENVAKKIISKIPPTIQVKKFASVNVDNLTKPKIEKKAQKRPASPKPKSIIVKNPISIAPCPISGNMTKKIRDNSSNIVYEVECLNQNEISQKKIGRPLGSKNKKKKLDVQKYSQIPKKIGRPLGSKNKKYIVQSLMKPLFYNEVPLTLTCNNLEQETLPNQITIDIEMNNMADMNAPKKKRGRPCLGDINGLRKRGRPSLADINVPKKRGRPKLADINGPKQGRPRLADINGPRKRGRPRLADINGLKMRGWPCLAEINVPKKRGWPKAYLTPKEQPPVYQGRTYDELIKSIYVEVAADERQLMTASNILSPIRFPAEPIKKVSTPRPCRPRILGNNFNGFSPRLYNPLNNVNMNMNNLNMGMINDNINLSLDSLTQGLDFAAVQAMNNSNPFGSNDDVVCTPDFPLEPLCEVTEDNDDDVECITPTLPSKPAGRAAPPPPPPPLVPRAAPLAAPLAAADNIIQMTESDVTVNSQTGGLKFRVDPQTLSANKMYRLPDGRIFAINANPNMPGGYSATIVSQNVDGTPKITARSETFAAKLSAVPHPAPAAASAPKSRARSAPSKRRPAHKPKPVKARDTYISRETDTKVPVEWYRYNMLDAVDALEYSLSRLHKLKKETTSVHLRSRTVDEMKYLHRTLEQLLATSSKRFLEIRDTLNKEMRMFLAQKQSPHSDDDDVEILPNPENEDPIFIDENSNDSVGDEVDLTQAASSHNDSTEAGLADPSALNATEDSNGANALNHFDDTKSGDGDAKEHLLGNHDDSDKMETDEVETSPNDPGEAELTSKLNGDEKTDKDHKTDDDRTDDDELDKSDKSDKSDKFDHKRDTARNDENVDTSKQIEDKVDGGEKSDNDDALNAQDTDALVPDVNDADKRVDPNADRDTEISEELIENLLKDDNLDENASMEMADLQEAEEILS